MASTIDPDLERAIEHFKNQPGVNADQVAQLRSAIEGDPQLLLDLNQAAVAGQIRGLAPQPAVGTTPNLVGTYDLRSGVITLPASSLQASGTTASADLNAVLQVQEMSVRFANGRYPDPSNPPGTLGGTLPVTQDMVDNLQATLNGSPLLAETIKRAATLPDPGNTDTPPRNHVENFGFVSDTRTAGNYDGKGKTINILAAQLQPGTYDPVSVTFLLGHAIEHGFNHPITREAAPTLRSEAAAVAAGTGITHDYTGAIDKYVQSGRNNEAEAEIAGWNAVLSRLQQSNPSANLTEMMNTGNPNMPDFVQRLQLHLAGLVARPERLVGEQADAVLQVRVEAPGDVLRRADVQAVCPRDVLEDSPERALRAIEGDRHLDGLGRALEHGGDPVQHVAVALPVAVGHTSRMRQAATSRPAPVRPTSRATG